MNDINYLCCVLTDKTTSNEYGLKVKLFNLNVDESGIRSKASLSGIDDRDLSSIEYLCECIRFSIKEKGIKSYSIKFHNSTGEV